MLAPCHNVRRPLGGRRMVTYKTENGGRYAAAVIVLPATCYAVLRAATLRGDLLPLRLAAAVFSAAIALATMASAAASET
jgi:hypothetical protein